MVHTGCHCLYCSPAVGGSRGRNTSRMSFPVQQSHATSTTLKNRLFLCYSSNTVLKELSEKIILIPSLDASHILDSQINSVLLCGMKPCSVLTPTLENMVTEVTVDNGQQGH